MDPHDPMLSLALHVGDERSAVDAGVLHLGRRWPAAVVEVLPAPPADEPTPDDEVRVDGARLALTDSGTVLGVLAVGWEPGAALAEDDLRAGAAVLTVVLARSRALDAATAQANRLVEAQRISGVGSYDFEIASNTNTWSDQLYRIYGREPQSFHASYEKFLELLHPEDREHVMGVHQQAMATGSAFRMEERVHWPGGELRTLASWGEVVPGPDGAPARMVGICWDVTEQRRLETQLVQEALHDRLTGLPNRTLLDDRLQHALASRRAGDRPAALLFIDVDRFKVINDSLGHDAGDEVLVELADRLTSSLEPGDTVARFGGDEFVVLLESVASAGSALAVADRLQQALARPVAVQGAELVVSISIGVTVVTGTGTDAEAGGLVRDADAAMYRAKAEGGARSVLFAPTMHASARARLDVETELRRALVEGGLRVHYQPQHDLRTGRLVSLEALVRWQHPTRGLVGPGEFIPVAEETGLIVPLGEWVVEQACRQLAVWRAEHPGLPDLGVSVNVSGVQLARADYVPRLSRLLERAGLSTAGLELEITESVLMRDPDHVLEVLHQLRVLGIRLSIDDFGTGYSSLSQLKRLPVDLLKIDRAFVSGLGDDAEDSAIIGAVVALAGSLGMLTVAEGAETAVQVDLARVLGCTRVQGFHLGRPLPPEEIEALLAAEDERDPTALAPRQRSVAEAAEQVLPGSV